MARTHQRFGRVFFVTVAAGLAILASVPFWGAINEQWQAWGCFRRLHDPTEGARKEAAEDLARLGPAATAWVVRALGDVDPKLRVVACSILPRTDPDHPAPALDALANALKDGDAAVRQAAANQLGLAAGFLATRAGPAATGRAVAALRRAIGDGAKDVRITAVLALGALGPAAQSAIADLDRALLEAEPTFRPCVAEALLRIDPVGARPRVIAALQGLLANPAALWEEDRVVRLLKAETGEEATAAALIPLLRHDDSGVRSGALSFLVYACLGAQATRPALVAALESDDSMIRNNAAFFFLGSEPAPATRALDTLVDQLVNWRDGGYGPEDIIKKIRDNSSGALGRVVARLVETIDQPASQPSQRRNAIYALGVIGLPEAKPAGASLQHAAAAEDRSVALRSVAILARIDPQAAAPSLPLLLDESRPGKEIAARCAALATLGDLGPFASPAVPSLLQAADEEEIWISTAAIEALGKIDPARAAELRRSIRQGR